MDKPISVVENDVQNRDSVAWKKLCQYVEEIAENGSDEFVPREALGNELFAQIHTLPESISKLKNVTKMGLYGSALKRIPPEIGEMKSLEYFDPYTSYWLNWFPYEIMDCKKLKDSRISTRALFGNFKNRMEFPSLKNNPVRYFGDSLSCSICKKELTYQETNQLWVTLRTGTDAIPLLANICSSVCKEKIPSLQEEKDPYPYRHHTYVSHPHKGGSSLNQPPTEHEQWLLRRAEREEKEKLNRDDKDLTTKSSKQVNTDYSKIETVKLKSFKDLKPLKLIRKIWEK